MLFLSINQQCRSIERTSNVYKSVLIYTDVGQFLFTTVNLVRVIAIHNITNDKVRLVTALRL